MPDLFESFVGLCERRSVQVVAKDLAAIKAVSSRLGISSSELLSIITIELLEEAPTRLKSIPAILSRVRKRITREYKRNRRFTPLRFEPVSLHDEIGTIELRDAITQLSPMQAEVVQLALDGESIPNIASHIRRNERTVYRILNGAIDVLKSKMQ
jgi:hypothetical protein